jgi:ankyrin repeat protein
MAKKVMALLLDRRGDEVKITDEVVKVAAHCSQEGVLHLLQRRFAIEISVWLPTAQLYDASKTGDEKVVQRLLDLGVDPNSKDYYGRTPLWWSASNGHASVAILLLEQDNVQVNETDINGWTPLHEAARNGHKTLVEVLLSQDGADPNLKDNTGQTALVWAMKLRQVDIMHILRDHIGSKTVLAPE